VGIYLGYLALVSGEDLTHLLLYVDEGDHIDFPKYVHFVVQNQLLRKGCLFLSKLHQPTESYLKLLLVIHTESPAAPAPTINTVGILFGFEILSFTRIAMAF
jgi:hypothetical protein